MTRLALHIAVRTPRLRDNSGTDKFQPNVLQLIPTKSYALQQLLVMVNSDVVSQTSASFCNQGWIVLPRYFNNSCIFTQTVQIPPFRRADYSAPHSLRHWVKEQNFSDKTPWNFVPVSDGLANSADNAVKSLALFSSPLDNPLLLAKRTTLVLFHPQRHAAIVERMIAFAPHHNATILFVVCLAP